MKNEIKPTGRKEKILTQDIAGETLVYDLSSNKAYCLNETSSIIWQMCDGTLSVNEIAESISEIMSSSVSEDVVWLAIDQFQKDNLLENNEVEVPVFGGLSRREVIRKVGLASAIALPLISSIAVPTATMAQSACVDPCNPCTADSDCCSNACVTYGSPVCV